MRIDRAVAGRLARQPDAAARWADLDVDERREAESRYDAEVDEAFEQWVAGRSADAGPRA